MTQNDPRPDVLTRLRKGWKTLQLFEEVASPTTLAVLVLALVLGAVGLFGGWDRVRAAETEVPVVQSGQQVTLGPYAVTLVDAWLGDPPSKYAPLDSRTVMVRAKVVNTSDQPVAAGFVLQDAVILELPGCIQPGGRPSGGAGEGCQFQGVERYWDLKTGEPLVPAGALQPGVEVGLLITFAQQRSAPVPSTAQLQLSPLTWRQSVLDGQWMWSSPELVGTSSLPLQRWTSGRWGKK